MQVCYSRTRTNNPIPKCLWALACLWCAGLLSGLFVVYLSGDVVCDWILPAVYSQVSLVGLLGGLLLPLLFSYVFFRLSVPRLNYAVCFFRAALFGFVAFGIVAACGSAGWLIQALMMGSDLLSLPLLYWFWLRHMDGCMRSLGVDFLLVAIATLAAGLLEYYFAVPFLAQIVTF